MPDGPPSVEYSSPPSSLTLGDNQVLVGRATLADVYPQDPRQLLIDEVYHGLLSPSWKEREQHLEGIASEFSVIEAARTLSRVIATEDHHASYPKLPSYLNAFQKVVERELHGREEKAVKIPDDTRDQIRLLLTLVHDSTKAVKPIGETVNYWEPMTTILNEYPAITQLHSGVLLDMSDTANAVVYKNTLNIIASKLPPDEVFQLFSHIIEEASSPSVVRNLDGMLEALSLFSAEKEMDLGMSDQQFASAYQKEFSRLFIGIQKQFFRLGKHNDREEFARTYSDLVGLHPFVAMVYPDMAGDVLSCQTDTACQFKILDRIPETLSEGDAAVVLTRLIEENPSNFAPFFIDNILQVFDRTVALRRAFYGSPSIYSKEESQKIGRFFQTLQDSHSWLFMAHADQYYEQVQEQFFSLHPEFLSMFRQKPHIGEQMRPSKDSGFNHIHRLHALVGRLPPEEQQEVLIPLREFFSDKQYGLVRRRLIADIFDNNTSNNMNISALYRELHVTPGEIRAVFSDERIIPLLRVLIRNEEEYAFQIGFLLSQIHAKYLPDDVRRALDISSSHDSNTIAPFTNRINLCSHAEPFLNTSITDKAVVVVNDFLVAKLVGKTSALCIKTFITENGFTFYKGMWYAPTERDVRNHIKEAFFQRETHLHLDRVEWTVVRPVETDYDSPGQKTLLEKAIYTHDTLPQIGEELVAGLKREEYYKQTREEWDG